MIVSTSAYADSKKTIDNDLGSDPEEPGFATSHQITDPNGENCNNPLQSIPPAPFPINQGIVPDQCIDEVTLKEVFVSNDGGQTVAAGCAISFHDTHQYNCQDYCVDFYGAGYTGECLEIWESYADIDFDVGFCNCTVTDPNPIP